MDRSTSDSLDLEFALISEAPAIPGTDHADLEALARFLLAAEDAQGPWEISVVLVGEARLQALHRDYMGSDTPTDIMTFPLDESGAGISGGDLVISVDHARTEAATWGNTPIEELRFLVAHGLLHLLGWRDETAAQREVMLQRQRDLIEDWERLERSARGD